MMTHADPPSEVRSEQERRRAARVKPGPLRVRFHRTCEGILIDISETGALVQLPSTPPALKQVTLQLEFEDVTVALQARVVRSNPHQLTLPTATLARPACHAALEFAELTSGAAAAVRHLVRSH